ncbi:MAG: 1-pyrroline-5-carboxylate dehydrogenase [Moraxellaceae bacterium]|nr:1-pyrroline-5-carboxylate dehydrogenase [Moraxellaceae bacterium]
MTDLLSYQPIEVETWRLLSAMKRAEYLQSATETLIKLVDDKAKAKKAIKQILKQASQLDKRISLTGATGESNELYNQARGKTLVMGLKDAQKLPIIIQVISALLTGNQVAIYSSGEDDFAEKVVDILIENGISDAVIYLNIADSKEKIDEMVQDKRLAQVAVVGTIEEAKALSAKFSQTDSILTQIIPIIDQENLSEIFNPDYLHRFSTERVLTINTTAIGGNASLLELGTDK